MPSKTETKHLIRDITDPEYVQTANSASYDTSNTETELTNTLYTIPANRLQVGSVINIRSIVHVVSVNATPTLGTVVRYGPATTAIASRASLVASGADTVAADHVHSYDMYAVVRSLGTAGVLVGGGYFLFGAASSSASWTDIGIVTAATIDTTVANVVSMSANWSASHASNVAFGRYMEVSITGW